MPNTLPIDLSAQIIGTPANGVNLYQVPNASMKVLEAIINTTWEEGKADKTDFMAKIAALSDPGGLLNGVAAPADVSFTDMTGVSVTEPTITIADAAAGDVYTDFSTEYIALGTWLAGKFTDFKTTYFPDDQTFYTQAEDWLQAALADPSGLPAATRAQLLGDAQAAITAETSRAKDAVLATFASRRMPIPGGQAASAVLQLEQSAQDKMAAAARDVTKMSIEQLRFDIDKAIACRTVALSSAVDYIKALASAPEVSSRLVNIGYDAQSKMISAASQFYGARINAAELTNKVSQFNKSSKLDADTKNQAIDMSMVDAKLKALLAEAQSIAQMATSMFNNLHASVSMQAGGSTVTTQAQDVTA